MLNLPRSLSDHPSLIGIVRLPKVTFSTNEVDIPFIMQMSDGTYVNVRQRVDMATSIRKQDVESNAITVPKSKITDFFPYTYYVLCDGESEPLILYPQFLPSSFTVKGTFAISHSPVERYYPNVYKNDTTGVLYNITNTSQMMLPTATNEGMNFLNANANSIAQNKKSQTSSLVMNTLSDVATGVLTGGRSAISGVSNLVNGYNQIKQTNARNKDLLMTPTTISSFGSPSTRLSFNTDCVRLVKYTVRDEIKRKVENFCERYGNKYNNYATINHNTYKGYLKLIACDIDSKLDNVYIKQIKDIFERGVKIE